MFILHDIQGYGHNEIAELTGRSIGNSKSQLTRARRRLRELLDPQSRACQAGASFEYVDALMPAAGRRRTGALAGHTASSPEVSKP